MRPPSPPIDRKYTERVEESLARAQQEPVVTFVRVSLNATDEGEHLVYVTPQEVAHMRLEDLRAMHLETPELASSAKVVDGVHWVPLSAVRSVKAWDLSLDDFALRLEADASMLGDVALRARARERRPGRSEVSGSAFLNYALSTQCLDDDWDCQTLARSELGVHAFGALIFTDAVFSDPAPGVFRGVSQVTVDLPESRTRLRLGDNATNSGVFGSGAMVGGVGYFTEYAVDPTFVRHGLPAIEGLAKTPSRLDVFVNGNRVAQHEVPAGRFAITDIPTVVGPGEVQVRMRDAYGREQVIERPFYQASGVLMPGLQEYGVWVGALREDFGVQSWSYGAPSAFGFYRRGWTHTLTGGVSGEASPEAAVGSVEGQAVVFDRGVLTSSVAGSVSERGVGSAWTGGGAFRLGRWSLATDVTWFAAPWQTVAPAPTQARRRVVGRGAVDVSMGRLGSVGMRLTSQLYHDEPGQLGLTAQYGASLGNGVSLALQATASQPAAGLGIDDLWTHPASRELEAVLSLSWSPRHDVSVASAARTNEGGSQTMVRVQRNAPVGEGVGASAEIGAVTSSQPGLGGLAAAESIWALDGTWRGPFTVASASTQHGRQELQSWSGSVAGGLVLIDGSVHATRPVHDAFGLVRAGGVAGLPVYRSNQEVGRTDDDGELLVPDLLSHQSNAISLDLNTLPIDYRATEHRIEAVPGLRSGVVVSFEITRFTAVSGRLVTVEGDEARPLGVGFLHVPVEGGELTSPVGYDGSFYFEDLPVGAHVATGRFSGARWTCAFVVEAVETVLAELGEVRCERRP